MDVVISRSAIYHASHSSRSAGEHIRFAMQAIMSEGKRFSLLIDKHHSLILHYLAEASHAKERDLSGAGTMVDLLLLMQRQLRVPDSCGRGAVLLDHCDQQSPALLWDQIIRYDNVDAILVSPDFANRDAKCCELRNLPGGGAYD